MQTSLEPTSTPLPPAAQAMADDPITGRHNSWAGNRYQIRKQLGAGPDGVSYLAQERAGGSRVEFHVLAKAAEESLSWQRIQTRLRIVELLSHPARLAIYELLLDASPPAVACELVPSLTLASQRELDLRTVLAQAKQLCEVVAAAHRLALYHGDLSIETVFVDQAGQLRLDYTGLRTGRFLARNALERESLPTLAADMESLGQVLHWLLVDRTPMAPDAELLNGREFAAFKQLIRASRQREVSDTLRVADFATHLESLSEQLQTPAKPATDITNFVEIEPAEQAATGETDANDTMVFGTEEIDIHLDQTSDTPEPNLQPPINEAKTEGDPQDASSAAFQAAVRHMTPLQCGDQLGRYKIERKLGEGGMGAVFQATDLGSGTRVAIKVLHAAVLARGSGLKRFHKEARMLAKVNNPYVANLIEVNEDQGRHYLVIEFVEGHTLKKTLASKEPLEQPEALQIIADVARALVDAHELGIVHRDIKPENIHLIGSSAESGDHHYTVKLLDFGIAREIDQSESMAMTQQGVMLGTPLYMSPEQCKGQGETGPQSDVYSLGITLYEMLCGQTPFKSRDPMKLAAMHCFDPPPELRKKNAAVSEAAAAIVNKALAKRPSDRYADATHFLHEVDQLLRGETSQAHVHPQLPTHDPAKLFQLDLAWDLESSPRDLWPYVSNTDRLNRAIGLPAATFRTEVDPQRGIRKFGSFRMAGVKVAWEEHPFEWIEGRRMGVLREFESGPFLWFVNIVELEPLAEGGTKLHHKVRIAPRNMLGRMLAKLEADWKGRRSLKKVYQRIDGALRGKLAEGLAVDPFEPARPLPSARQQRLQQRLEKLIERGVSADVAGKLGEYLATAAPQEVAKIRPIALADHLEVEQDEMLHACLLAAVEGLLTLAWDVLCPTCRAPSDAKQSLKQLEKHTYCEACDLNFDSNLASSVELVFRVHPELRQADAAHYCVGGPYHAPHVVAQLRLEAEERTELETELPPGEYILRGPGLANNFTIAVRESGAPSHAEIHLRADADPRQTTLLRGGKQLMQITNQYNQLQVIRLERTLPRHDLVTAAQASALPLFRKLFPGQVLSAGQLMAAEQVTLLVTAIENVDSLYAELGDSQAYSLIQNHMEIVEQVVRDHGGAIVKIVGEGIQAAWHDCTAAVRAATALQAALDKPAATRRLQLSVGVHRGPALVTTVNDRLDYFGATARVASILPTHAQGGVALTEAVYSDPEVSQLIQQQFPDSVIRSVNLPGAPRSLITQLCASAVGKEV